MAGFTDDELGLGGGFSDEDLGIARPKGVVQSALDLDRQFTSAVLGGVVESAATALRGAGAAIEAGPAEEGRGLQTAIEAVQGGQDPSQAIETARQFGPRFQPVSEQPLYQAGERVSQFGKESYSDAELLHPVVRDIGGAAGSVLGNVAVGLTPGVGPAGLIATGTLQGRGEATQRAVQAGATPEQQVQAGQLGAAPGLTDFADLALTRSGLGGIGASRLRRVLVRLAQGGLIEGSQEGFQQFLQNAIARGVYKPDQDLSEGVLYNAFLGAIVGGGVNVVAGGSGPSAGAPAPEADVEAIARDMASGVARPPPGAVPGAPEPGTLVSAPPEVPAATGPEEFGLGPTPTEPPGAAPTAPPETGRRVYPPGVELRQEDGMWNVYVNGGIDNAFGARSDADNYIRQFRTPMPVAPTEAPPQFPEKPQPLPTTHVDPEVSSFLARRAPPLSVAPMKEEIQSAPGANLGRLAALLGPKLYGSPKDLTAVSVKEMVQNSFDAIKGMLERGLIQKGRLDIILDRRSRTLTIQDNGSGMAPEVLGRQFLEIAGTKKESERASGGLGIAKMLFLFGNQNLEVITLRDNKVSILQTTGKQLFSALDNPADAPKITVRAPTRQDRTLFPEGHGTVVRVKVPETFSDPSTGEMQPIPFNYYSENYYPVLKRSPLFDNIEVTFNGVPVEGMGTRFPVQDYTQFANVNFDWGTARIYVSKQMTEDRWQDNAHVLSNGLWQFSFRIPKNPAQPYGESIQRNFYIDVSPKVRPEDAGYPFDLNRQQFSPQARKDFDQIFNYVSKLYQQTDFVQSVHNFGDIQYLESGPSGVVAGPKQKLEPWVPARATAASEISEGDQVTVQNGKLVVNGRQIPELRPEDLESFAFDLEELTVPQNSINASVPILHDNVDVIVSDVQTVSITDLMREKFGQRFDDFVYGMGKAFIDLRDVVAEIGTGMRVEEQRGMLARIGVAPAAREVEEKPWTDLKKEGIGISFDNEYRGVSIRLPFSASFLNVAVPEFTDTLRAAVGMVGTMVHELAHHRVRNHDAAFPAEMQRILIHLDVHPTFNFYEFKQRVVDLVQQHRDVFEYLNGVMTSGTFTVQPRGKRFTDTGSDEARDGIGVSDLGAAGLRTGREPTVFGRIEAGATSAGAQSRSSELSISLQSRGPDAIAQQRLDTARLSREASDGRGPAGGPRGAGPDAAFRQPEFERARQRVDALFQSTGGTPTAVKTAASHADRMNRWYKWMAGLDQLLKANPQFLPLRKYFSDIQQMHNEESKIQDAALRIAKRWRSLGDQGERLAAMFDDVANMRYRTADEIRRGIERHPTADELRALIAKHRLDAEGVPVFDQVRKMFDGFLELIKANAFAAAQRIITDPNRLAAKLGEIQAQIDALRARPYFPLMRFGLHYVMKKDAAGRVTHFETFERHGFRSAESYQRQAEQKLRATAGIGEKVFVGKLPESSSSFVGLPSTLLETIKTELQLTPDQITALEHLQLMQSPALNFKRMMKSDYVPGYSIDFKRAFARYFFHGARYYARTKYGHGLRNHIAEAARVPNNKANMIADYMQDHLQNTILDAKGDFGIFKGGTFLWALAYMPAAATMNMLQTPTVTYSHLAAKFGGLGLGNARAGKAIVKAAADVRNFYKRQTYDKMTGFEFEALSYGIKTGRVSETQAPELAGISAGNNLLQGIGGNPVQRGWTAFMEKGTFMFEMAEQFNRRVAFRAALDLAMKYPNSKAVREATSLYSAEYQSLQAAATGRRAFTAAEAAAVVTAVHTVDQTQFIYGRYARPRFMRGRLAGTLFVFKKYLQSMLFWMGQNKSDALPQYLIMMALLGGLSGAPGYEDLRDLLRAFAKWFFGKDFNLDRKTRELVTSLFNDKIDADLVLHGLARVGFGVPALLDLIGSWVTGREGRGLTSQISSNPANPQGRGQNVAFPVLDRHRALSMGPLLGFSPGALMLPQADRDLDHTIAEQTQKASGAVFGLGFNIYKAAMSENSWSDFKKYERAVPRALGALSRAYRAYSEGRERGRGGVHSAPTIVPYDVRDSEQMMEVIFMGLGYQPLRQQARWDNILAKVEVEKFYDGKRTGLMAQYDEALRGGNAAEVEKVKNAIREFNAELPEFARGQAITADILRSSLQNRARTRQLRELGRPLQKRNTGISHEIDRLYREGAVDVRPVR